MLFAAEAARRFEMQVVDLFTGEQYQAAIRGDQPEPPGAGAPRDGSLRLTESSAILKIPCRQDRLAVVPEGPAGPRPRPERMDWINTSSAATLAYGLVYPQIFPFHKRRSQEAPGGHRAMGQGARRAG